MAEHALLRALGKRLRALRAEQRISRQRLSEATGISVRYLASVESGRGNISVLLLHRVAHAMGVGAHRLLDNEALSASSLPGEIAQAPSSPGNR